MTTPGREVGMPVRLPSAVAGVRLVGSPAGGSLLRLPGDPGAPAVSRKPPSTRRSCAHRNTLLESAAFGLDWSTLARQRVFEPGRCPRRNTKEQQHMTIAQTTASPSVIEPSSIHASCLLT